MPTEREKMLAGELYDPLDAELISARGRARDLCHALNATTESQRSERRRILEDLLGSGGDTVWMQPPFYCDYGANIHLGTRVFFNFNCIVLDVCEVRIGDYTLFGPGVQVLTPLHPLDAASRRKQEFGKPIEIGSDVLGWRRRVDPRRRAHRIARGDRRRQRRYARYSRRCVRCGNPCRVIRREAGSSRASRPRTGRARRSRA